ncbi:DUF2326 domain-containing protein [Mesorhizobium sp. M1322]|uniref:DUF2326 domain-containing protein n=1 Tax=Mesorhizobium sp. M1322 TaxID=2957081 RepID=UPI00333985F7
MQLSRLYSNSSDIFEPIDFNSGRDADRLNIVIGEVHRPRDRKRDSHNLGKTTLLHLIDFMMLKGMSPDHFLAKHHDRFQNFVFFLEIALNDGDYATVRRSVESATKIAMRRHPERDQDFTDAADGTWDHVDLPIDEAVKLLDAWLDLRILKPYDYRKAITYFLRAQGDWSDELQLQKFQAGRDVYWKPFVAHLFGFDSRPVERKYELDEEISKLKHKQAEQQSEVQFSEDELPKLTARIGVLEQQMNLLEEQLDAFRFDDEERRIMRDLVEQVEREISELNERLYNIRYDVRQIDAALDHKDKFDLKEVESIFSESQLHFPGQLKKQYEDLVAFNRKVTHERNTALRGRRKTLNAEMAVIDVRKAELDDKREQQLRLLRSTDTFEKFKVLQRELAVQRAQLVYLEEQRRKLEQVAETAKLVRESERERGRVVDEIKTMVARPTPLFERFSKTFNAYCQRVLNHEGIFYFEVNSNGNFDYTIGLGLAGQVGQASGQGDGTSYKKLICALFDLSLLKIYENASFFHFVYHDGVFEALDDRKKLALLEVIREQIAVGKTQYIMTLIAADLPKDAQGDTLSFNDNEIILRLHDEGPSGRLFKTAEF